MGYRPVSPVNSISPAGWGFFHQACTLSSGRHALTVSWHVGSQNTKTPNIEADQYTDFPGVNNEIRWLRARCQNHCPPHLTGWIYRPVGGREALDFNTSQHLKEMVMDKKLAAALMILAFGAGSAAAQDVTYRKDIAPLWQAKCSVCHGDSAPERSAFELDEKGFELKLKGPRMDSYERLVAFVGWPDAGALMRRLDDGTSPNAGGKPGNMYQNLGATDKERAANLKTFKAWVGEGAWNLNHWEKEKDVAAIKKDQLDKIKIKY
jgi:hypothetical protein